MLSMDFGKSWCNVYRKFEAACQDVDDFVSNKDNVKHVIGNSVQSFGESVKKLCSMVEEYIPHTNPTNSEEIGISKHSETMEENIKAVDKGENLLLVSEQLRVDADTVDPPNNEETSLSTELLHEQELISSLSSNASEDGQMSSSCKLNSYANSIATDKSITDIFPEQEILPHSLSDVDNCVSNASNSVQLSSPCSCTDNNQVQEVDFASSSTSISMALGNTLKSSECICKADVENTQCGHSEPIGYISSVSSGFPCDMLLPTSAGNKKTDDTIQASISSATTYLADASIIGGEGPVAESNMNENNYGQFPENTRMSTLPSLEKGSEDETYIDIADPDMETIDLSDNQDLGESCVIVDSKLLCGASCESRNFRSYKKLIQDAFTSRKRLVKEYKQLAILYGDIDTGSSKHINLFTMPSQTGNHSDKQVNCNTFDAEWELL